MNKISTTKSFPEFRYHPNPLVTGNIQKSDMCCECCGENTGYIYTGPIYAIEDIEYVCPWCIASGVATEKFDATFCDAASLIEANIPESVIEEVTQRTPGYNSWQQGEWKAHCNDACEFHGDAPKDELGALNDEYLLQFLGQHFQ